LHYLLEVEEEEEEEEEEGKRTLVFSALITFSGALSATPPFSFEFFASELLGDGSQPGGRRLRGVR